MGIVDVHEHTTCVNYEGINSDVNTKPAVEVFEMDKGTIMENTISEPKVLLVVKGQLNISYERYVDKPVTEGKMVLLPSSCKYIAKTKEDTSIVILRLRDKIELCDRLGLEQLFNKFSNLEYTFNLLDINEEMKIFLKGLSFFVNDGLKCRYYLELKVKEFFFIIRVYYSKEDLARFFYPLLSNDTSFSEFVYNNYSKVKTVQELAALSNYSHSGFIKRFKKTFGIPAYQWMKRQKASRILHEINCTDKAIKQICDEYDFSSLSQFNDFCKSSFGYPPSKIRKNKSF